MKQEIVFSGQADAESAVQELVRKLNNPPESYNAVLFFHRRTTTLKFFQLCCMRNSAERRL